MATPNATALSAEERAQLKKLIAAQGDIEVAAKLLVHRQTIARALAGLSLRASTAQCMRSRMSELAAG